MGVISNNTNQYRKEKFPVNMILGQYWQVWNASTRSKIQ